MREINATDIQRYVHHVALHPFENIDEVSKMYFEDASPSLTNKSIAIPELLSLPLTKRALVANIVREKTNYEISPESEEAIKIIRGTGEELKPIFKPEISVVKEVEKSEEI